MILSDAAIANTAWHLGDRFVLPVGSVVTVQARPWVHVYNTLGLDLIETISVLILQVDESNSTYIVRPIILDTKRENDLEVRRISFEVVDVLLLSIDSLPRYGVVVPKRTDV